MYMRKALKLGLGIILLFLCACGQNNQKISNKDTVSDIPNSVMKLSSQNQVVETIMARRSIRKYKPIVIEQDKLSRALECGINAPNGMYKQSWEIRVVNNSKFMNEIEKGYTAFQKKEGRKRIMHPSFGAPCLVFIAHDTTYDLSQVDCGLLGENIILSAQSMGLGTCCLGGIVRYLNSSDASDLLKQLEIPDSYKLLYAIAIGYPNESPASKPRDTNKIKFID